MNENKKNTGDGTIFRHIGLIIVKPITKVKEIELSLCSLFGFTDGVVEGREGFANYDCRS